MAKSAGKMTRICTVRWQDFFEIRACFEYSICEFAMIAAAIRAIAPL